MTPPTDLKPLWWCSHWKTLNEHPHDGKPCTDAYYYRGEEVDAKLERVEKENQQLRDALEAAEPYIAAATEVANKGCGIDAALIRHTLGAASSEPEGR